MLAAARQHRTTAPTPARALHAAYLALGCVLTNAMASSADRIFSASASGIVMTNSSCAHEVAKRRRRGERAWRMRFG